MDKENLMYICKNLAETTENPTHFMIIRQVKSVLFHLNPWPELNIDKQLDMYAIHFYDGQTELSTKMQFGLGSDIFYEDKLYPLYCLFMACAGKSVQLENGKLPIPHVIDSSLTEFCDCYIPDREAGFSYCYKCHRHVS